MSPVALLFIAQISGLQIPAPRGYVNDFAGVIDAASAARVDSVVERVRALTQGDIAVVTLADLGGREAADVALQIGREWKVGGSGEAGDPERNLGVVVLVVPRKNHEPGTGAVFIATGRGAEGFLPDARVGRIRDAMIPALAREDYGAAVETGVGLLAQAFADEFHVTLGVPVAQPPPERPQVRIPGFAVFIVFVLLLILLSAMSRAARGGRRRGGGWWWPGGGGWTSGGFGGWGSGGSGGGFSGGFGGFGGGGGFSGGGAGGKF